MSWVFGPSGKVWVDAPTAAAIVSMLPPVPKVAPVVAIVPEPVVEPLAILAAPEPAEATPVIVAAVDQATPPLLTELAGHVRITFPEINPEAPASPIIAAVRELTGDPRFGKPRSRRGRWRATRRDRVPPGLRHRRGVGRRARLRLRGRRGRHRPAQRLRGAAPLPRAR